MIDLESLMGQAKNFQAKMKEDLQRMAISASSGGGAVKVVVNGNKELTKIEFSADAPTDHELLADLVLAAMNGAYAEVEKEIENRVPNVLGNMDLSAVMDMFKK